MNEFVYSYPTKVYFGKKTAVDGLAKELAGVGQNVMLAYGGGSVKRNGVYDEVMSILKNAGKNVVEFGGILPNPTYAKVQEGARLAKEQGVEFVLALDGGSVVDCCKIICVQALSEEDIWTMEIEQGRFPSQAQRLFDRLMKQRAELEGITETLKAGNQMEWIRRMNALRSAVTETVNAEVIFV